jgi:hypothetical protein
MEESMTNLYDQLPKAARDLLAEVIGPADGRLLESLQSGAIPSQAQRREVERILSDEFVQNLGPDYEPNLWGKTIESALDEFLLRFPIETGGETGART